MASYKLSAEAREDLKRIYFYGLETWDEVQADKYYLAFFDQFEKIADNPSLYQSVDSVRSGYRRCVCGVDAIYFRVVGDVVEITRILGRQQTSRLFSDSVFLEGED